MATKKINYSIFEIKSLPNNKPIMYTIQTASGRENYIGIAKKGRGQDRLIEHYGNIPGAKIKIEQFGSIKDAQAKEGRMIKKNQPKYNKQGK